MELTSLRLAEPIRIPFFCLAMRRTRSEEADARLLYETCAKCIAAIAKSLLARHIGLGCCNSEGSWVDGANLDKPASQKLNTKKMLRHSSATGSKTLRRGIAVISNGC